MTKLTLTLALCAAAIATPALAQHSSNAGYSASPAATDPCVLGTNTQPGACVGPVRVAPVIMSQGSVSVQPQQSYSGPQALQPAPSYGVTTIAHHQPPVMAVPVQVAAQSIGGCVQNYPAAMAGCNGNWRYAPNNQGGFVPNGYSQQGFVQNSYGQSQVVTQQYAPTPVQYAPAPAPVVYQQAPQYYAPAPIQYAPAPVQYAPAPVQYAPAPVQYAPAPYQQVQYQQVQYTPQPQPVGYISPSFFTGGITYGAGFPEGSSYSYGGGGGFIVTGGGTRFSGVRERSPTPLIAPPTRRSQRHAPPPKHCGHC
jgi:hypothetical protein